MQSSATLLKALLNVHVALNKEGDNMNKPTKPNNLHHPIYAKSASSNMCAMTKTEHDETLHMNNIITHETRREAHEKIKPKKPTRKKLILGALSNLRLASANDIARALYHAGYIEYPDRNFVQPRLNELEKESIVEVCDKKKDRVTNVTVAVYRIKERG